MRRCLLVCEGPNDELIFSMFKEIFDESIFEIKPLNGCCADAKNLIKNVEKIVDEILSREHGYYRDDFDEICFLIDSDGVFVDESVIVENKLINHTNYNLDSIECKDRKMIILRNRNRIKNINELLKDGNYKIYYNSRNLEHAFDSKYSGHISDKAKKRFALNTITAFANCKDELINKLYFMNKSRELDLVKSWDYLKINNNSLLSASNIFIFIFNHYNDLKSEYKDLVDELVK